MSRARVSTGNSSSVPSSSGIRLAWPGRTFEPSLDTKDSQPPPRPWVRVIEEVSGGPAAEGVDPIRLIRGDALEVAEALAPLRGTVDLVYADPPFASDTDYVHEARLDGPADGRVERTLAFGDRWGKGDQGLGAYLDMLAPRLEAMARLLSPRGSLWVHLDWRAAYLVRLLLDEILGRAAFKNEIVWKRAPNLGRQAKSQQFGRTLDTLLVYGGPACSLVPPTRLEPIAPKAIRHPVGDGAGDPRPFTCAPRGDYTDASIARLDAEGRVHRTPSGKVYIKYFLTKNDDGVWCRERPVDTLWTDIAALRHSSAAERTGYPTQKPRALLERVILASTKRGALVVDLFGGSGTTGEAAFALGRRAVLGDMGAVAQATMRARLLRAGAPVRVEACVRDGEAVEAPTPCEVTIEPLPGGQVKVGIQTPRNALAWALDLDARPDLPFRTSWHSERRPGIRSLPSAAEAAVTPRGDLAVRAYQDDGTVCTAQIPRHMFEAQGPAAAPFALTMEVP